MEDDQHEIESFLTPLIIVIVYTLVDGLHRFLFIQRQARVSSNLLGYVPLAESCESEAMHAEPVKVIDMSRREFAAHAENIMHYARSFKGLCQQLVQDFFGLWTPPNILQDAKYSTGEHTVFDDHPFNDVDVSQWRRYLIALALVIMMLIVSYILLASFWKEYQRGMELYHSPLAAFKYAYSQLEPMDKIFLAGFYIVFTVLVLKTFGRFAYHGTILLCIAFVVIILFIVFLMVVTTALGSSTIKYFKNDIDGLVDMVASMVTDPAHARKHPQDLLKHIQAPSSLKENAIGLLSVVEKDFVSKASMLLAGDTCILEPLRMIPQIAVSNFLKRIIKKKAKAAKLEGLGDDLLDKLNPINAKGYSVIGYMWLLSTDYVNASINKTNAFVNDGIKSCLLTDLVHKYDFQGAPLTSFTRFMLFEKQGTMILLSIIISIHVIHGAYEVCNKLNISENISEWFHDELASDSENNERPVTVGELITVCLVTSMIVFIIYVGYMALMVALRNYVSSNMANWFLSSLPEYGSLSFKHYLFKELIVYDHIGSTEAVKMPSCEWIAVTKKSILYGSGFFLLTLAIATVVTCGYAHVHLTSLNHTKEEKNRLKASFYTSLHKSIVITCVILVILWIICTSFSK
jgi:hypothetical protein